MDVGAELTTAWRALLDQRCPISKIKLPFNFGVCAPQCECVGLVAVELLLGNVANGDEVINNFIQVGLALISEILC